MEDRTKPHGIRCDGVYGNTGVETMKAFQESADLDVDGGVGPATRHVLREDYDFDFETLAREVGGTTVFVQPDGTQIIWSPEA